MKHYTKEDLELYRHHQLSILGRIACAAHLKECPILHPLENVCNAPRLSREALRRSGQKMKES